MQYLIHQTMSPLIRKGIRHWSLPLALMLTVVGIHRFVALLLKNNYLVIHYSVYVVIDIIHLQNPQSIKN